MCFGDYQKFIGNGDRIGNLLEHLHHQNINFLVLRREMSNLLEMLFISFGLWKFDIVVEIEC